MLAKGEKTNNFPSSKLRWHWSPDKVENWVTRTECGLRMTFSTQGGQLLLFAGQLWQVERPAQCYQIFRVFLVRQKDPGFYVSLPICKNWHLIYFLTIKVKKDALWNATSRQFSSSDEFEFVHVTHPSSILRDGQSQCELDTFPALPEFTMHRGEQCTKLKTTIMVNHHRV